jgi:nucleotidyltransferase substrate binding protein (TIGR01987 family)
MLGNIAYMQNKDIRWKQRLGSFSKALSQLNEAVELSRRRALSKLEEQGLIQAFEYTHELAWNTLKDFLKDRGNAVIYGSKDASREAFKLGIIENGEVWMDMIKSRNMTTHTYNEETAREITEAITTKYFEEFNQLKKQLDNIPD